MKIDAQSGEYDVGGWEVPAKGRYIAQIDEGTEHGMSSKNRPQVSVSLKLVEIVRFVNKRGENEAGSEDSVGSKIRVFFSGLDDATAEMLFGRFLANIDLAAYLNQKWPSEPIYDNRVLDDIIWNMQGRSIGVMLDHEPDYKDPNKTRAKVVKHWSIMGKQPVSQPMPAQQQQPMQQAQQPQAQPQLQPQQFQPNLQQQPVQQQPVQQQAQASDQGANW